MKAVISCGYGKSLLLFRRNLLLQFLNSGCSVKVLSPDISDADAKELGRLKISTMVIPMSRTRIKPLSDITYFVNLCLFFKKEKPDFFFSYTIKPVIYGLIASWISGVPKRYAMITGLGYAFGQRSLKQKIIGLLSRLLYKISLSKAKIVFFQNPDDLVKFTGEGLVNSEKAFVVNGSGVDLNLFPKSKIEYDNQIVFLMVSRILHAKGIVEYLSAAKIASPKLPNAKWLLIGPLDEENPDGLKEKEFTEHLSKSPVEYLGFSSNIQKYMEKCHIYVLPSYREGCPRSVLEAMATGRAIITTDVPGCRQTVVNGYNGKLVEVSNSESLADAMIELGNNYKMLNLMGIRSRKIAEEKFDADTISREMIHKMLMI